MSAATARIMPTVFQDRCGISLFDAQYSTGTKGPIPEYIIKAVIVALKRFKKTCHDFEVDDDNVRIIATEATRQAINSAAYRQRLETATGWKVEMLAKEDEGRVGAMGVASSFSSIKGLVLDLGGGSVQLTWLISENGEIQTCQQGAVSQPYGAAALMRLLSDAEGQVPTATQKLQQQIVQQFVQAIKEIDIPQTIWDAANDENGLTLYLSGGGFRGWGYILMASHVIQPYPISIINGFQVGISQFNPSFVTQSGINNSMFGVSSRRVSQVPAIVFLITAILEALPLVSNIYFAQGGVREGNLFSTLPTAIRSQHPLVAATAGHGYSTPSTATFVDLLRAGLPIEASATGETTPDFLKNDTILIALSNLLNVHASLPKDTRASAALRSTTTGILANAHGLAHQDRALLALALCHRWGANIGPGDQGFYNGLQKLIGPQNSWWVSYIGGLAKGIGDVYPASKIRDGELRIALSAKWDKEKKGSQEKPFIAVSVWLPDGELEPDWVESLRQIGKKKNWVQGEDGNALGFRLSVKVLGLGH